MTRSSLSPEDKRIISKLERLYGRRLSEIERGIYQKKLNKRSVCSAGRVKFYTVNGEFVRNRVEIEFTMNANWRSDAFVPKGEAWIDDRLSPFDGLATIKHELLEWQLIRGGTAAESAHEEATRLEAGFRKTHGS